MGDPKSCYFAQYVLYYRLTKGMPTTTRDSYFFKKAFKKLIPLHCLFELTYRCNLDCVHCYIPKDTKEELTKWKIFNIFEQLKEAGCLYLTFSGGEIFLRKDFFEIAEYARELNFCLRLFTNGTLITENIVNKIKELYPIAIEISLYGFKDVHEKITQVSGSFDRTIKTIKLLRDRGIKVLVKATIMKQNVDQIWKLQKFVKEKLKVGWRGIGGDLLISPCDNGDSRSLNYRLDDEELKDYIREEFEAKKSFNKEVKLEKVKKSKALCGAAFIVCNVTPCGELNPCVQIRLRDNSLNDKSFMEIWRGHTEILKLRNLHIGDRDDCWKCGFNAYCFICPGIALLECGSLTAKLPEACRQARIRKEVYGNL